MARGDGIHRTNARNMRLTAARIGNAQQHNEREKESYVNQDIVPERTRLNIHFKKPTAGYAEMFEQMKEDGIISTRGLKEDAFLYGELVFDVNTAYFHNHGGYDFAKQFYTDAYKSAIEIVGGEQYILSAVMHADERNRAMSDALGQDVYHYHLHVVYIPIVEKQILPSRALRIIFHSSCCSSALHFYFCSLFWKRPHQDQGVSSRDQYQRGDMQQLHLRGKPRVIGKRAERVDGGMHEDAGNQAAAAIKKHDQQEAHRNGKDDLAQIVYQIHAAAVEQLDDMPNAEGDAGNDDSGFDMVPCDGLEQKAPEDHLFQKADAKHARNAAGRFRRRIIDGGAVPQISRRQNRQRHIVKEPTGMDGRSAKPVPLLQIVLSDKGKKNTGNRSKSPDTPAPASFYSRPFSAAPPAYKSLSSERSRLCPRPASHRPYEYNNARSPRCTFCIRARDSTSAWLTSKIVRFSAMIKCPAVFYTSFCCGFFIGTQMPHSLSGLCILPSW